MTETVRKAFRLDAAILLLVSALVVGCGTPQRTLFSRFTLEVDTPEGLKIGSTTNKYSIGPNDGLFAGFSPAGIFLNFWGEATVLDLGDRGLLFCVLDKDSERPRTEKEQGSIPQLEFILSLFPQPDRTTPLAVHLDGLLRIHPSIEVSNAQLPLLVRFRDLTNPSTAERVDPNNLAASFGPGVHIARSKFEILPAPKQSLWQRWFSPPPEIQITKSIQAVLPWLSLPDEQLDVKLVGPMWNRNGPPKYVSDKLSISSFFFPVSMVDVK